MWVGGGNNKRPALLIISAKPSPTVRKYQPVSPQAASGGRKQPRPTMRLALPMSISEAYSGARDQEPAKTLQGKSMAP